VIFIKTIFTLFSLFNTFLLKKVLQKVTNHIVKGLWLPYSFLRIFCLAELNPKDTSSIFFLSNSPQALPKIITKLSAFAKA